MTDLETIRNAGRTQVMGVLNITEDSFSDGGQIGRASCRERV